MSSVFRQLITRWSWFSACVHLACSKQRGWLEVEICRDSYPSFPFFFPFGCRLHLPSAFDSLLFATHFVEKKFAGTVLESQNLRCSCFLHSRLKDHERVAFLASHRRLCPMLAPCTNKDNDGDTACIVSYMSPHMFSSPPTFRRSEHQI